MSKKVQIWLRLDQAECVIAALDYADTACRVMRADGLISGANRVLVVGLAADRIREVSAIVNEAVAKVQS